MKRGTRPVDQAMDENRIEKRVVRSFWLEALREVANEYPDTDVPWYLTLSGAKARDIQLLIDEGILSLTEVQSIKEEDQHKVVAVESNNEAILALQKKLPGLKIKRAPFQNLIRGDDLFAWPNGDDEKYCRAHIVNLDLNNPLRGITQNEEVKFPVLSWIKKLSQLHARPPRYDWTLCLTLHAEVVWPEEVNVWTKSFLEENLSREPDFAESCRGFLGEELIAQLSTPSFINFSALDRTGQQKIIMVMVPKIIAKLVHNQGWIVSTERNLRYGQKGSAPMVTWVVKFTWSAHGSATPDTLYREALKDIFSGAGVVTNKGEIEIPSDC